MQNNKKNHMYSTAFQFSYYEPTYNIKFNYFINHKKLLLLFFKCFVH